MNPRGMLVALLGASSAAAAHDFWVEPSTFHADVGEIVSVALCEGDPFDGRPYPRDVVRIAQFVARGPAGEQPIVGREGRELAGVARFANPGVYVLGYHSTPSVTEVEAGKFEQYLSEKGLERIAEHRRARGLTHQRAREAYSRYSKSLLRVGEARDIADARPLGFRLELVPEFRPEHGAGGAEFSFRLLFDGKPLQDTLVAATPREEPYFALHSRTDADGRLRYTMRHAGEWLLTAVHMVEAAPGTHAHWESFWSSLTFELPSKGQAASASRRPCAS